MRIDGTLIGQWIAEEEFLTYHKDSGDTKQCLPGDMDAYYEERYRMNHYITEFCEWATTHQWLRRGKENIWSKLIDRIGVDGNLRSLIKQLTTVKQLCVDKR